MTWGAETQGPSASWQPAGRWTCSGSLGRAAHLAAIWLIASTTTGAAAAGLQAVQPFSKAAVGEALPAPWRVVAFPGGGRALTRFSIEAIGPDRVLRIAADKSYGNALHEVKPVVLGAGSTLKWSWRLEKPLRLANLKSRDGDDVALKVCALFDLSLDKLGFVERNVMRMARSRSSDPIPAATLCYVWDHLLPEGSRLPNIYSQRLRFVVLNSGDKALGQWQTHERDLAADFKQAFGHEADEMPPLVAIAVGADADNTGDSSLAYVGDISLTLTPATPATPMSATPAGVTPTK